MRKKNAFDLDIEKKHQDEFFGLFGVMALS
jgi:hypothetical protein